MATVTINKRNFEQKVGKLDEKMKERISMLGCPVEDENKDELMVDVSPNRPDMLSEQGVIRSMLSFTGKKKGLQDHSAKKSDYLVIIDESAKESRPFTACAVVKSLSLNNSKVKELIDIQERLHATYGRNRKRIAIGIYPMEKIKFPISFKAMDPEKIKFRPLESEREMTGTEILSNHPAGKEYSHLLEGKKKFPVFIDSENNVLSMPPIINSHSTGKVFESTKEVFIECSGFDFNALSKCLSVIASVLADIGGEVYEVSLKYGGKTLKTPNMKPEKMKINAKNVNKLLGLNLKESEMKKCLEIMGFSYSKGTVSIPAYRADILHEVDLIEDIAIAYGYENFKEKLPQISTIGKESRIEILKRKTAEALVGLNMLETYSYSVTNKEDECRKMETKAELIELMNAKTNYNAIRSSMLPSLMKVLGDNRDVDYPQRIFELGKVFSKDSKEGKSVSESTSLATALTNSNFTEAKQTLDYLGKVLGIEFEVKESSHSSFIDGRTAEVLLKKKKVGIIGEIHPKVLSNWKLLVPVSAFELEIDKILEEI